MSWVTLSEAVEILSQELGFDKFIERSEFETQSDLKLITSGPSTTLDLSGTGNLQDNLKVNGFLLIGLIKYQIKSVTENSVEIDSEISLSEETRFSFVDPSNTAAWEKFYKTKEQSLATAYKIISRNVESVSEDVPESFKEAQSKLAAFYFQNQKNLPYGKDKTRIQSERIGDISTSYDTSKLQEKLPAWVIDILGNSYRSDFDPIFFNR